MIFLFGVRNFHPVFGGNSQTGKSCRKPLDKSKRGNYNDLTIKLTQTKREVRDKMSLQHCLVLTVATGAVWMDLRTRRIANEWIITAWIAGLVTQLIRYGTAGAGIFLFGMLFPILALSILRILQSECPSAMRRAADNPGSASTGPFRPVCR